jgi:hypothetical protein
MGGVPTLRMVFKGGRGPLLFLVFKERIPLSKYDFHPILTKISDERVCVFKFWILQCLMRAMIDEFN